MTSWLGVALVLVSLAGVEVALGEVVTPVEVGPLARASQDSLHLARATQLWQQGDVRGAVHWLATIDIGPDATFAQADRAAFLLAVAHLSLGDRASFLNVAAYGDPASERLYRQWLSYAQLRVTGSLAPDLSQPHANFWRLPGAVVLTAAHLLAAEQTVELETKWGGFKNMFGSEGGFILRAEGSGQLLVSAYGAIETWELQPGQKITLDTGHMVAYEASVEMELRKATGGLVQTFKSGEGLVFDFTGPGKLLVQTRNPSEFLGWISATLGTGNSGADGGAGGLIGGLLGRD